MRVVMLSTLLHVRRAWPVVFHHHDGTSQGASARAVQLRGQTKGVERGWDFRIEKAGRATFDAPGLDMSSAPCAGGSGDVPAAGPGEPPAAPSALHGMDGR